MVTVGALLSGLAIPLGSRVGAASPSTYQVTIQRTPGGIPHITGGNFGDVGYGFGYAFAQDNICTMAEDYVTVAAQRSRFFGPNATYTVVANGTTVTNIDSDIFWQNVADSGTIGRLLAVRSGPAAVSPELRSGVQGYVDGYNAYLHDVGGAAGVPDTTCRGKPWVRPITTLDAYLRFYQLVELASQDVAIQGISEAAPPPAGLVGGPSVAAPTRSRPAARACRAWPRSASSEGHWTPPPAAVSVATRWRSGRPAPETRRTVCFSATLTSPGTGPSASIRHSSRSQASSTSRVPRCSGFHSF